MSKLVQTNFCPYYRDIFEGFHEREICKMQSAKCNMQSAIFELSSVNDTDQVTSKTSWDIAEPSSDKLGQAGFELT